MAPMVSMFYNVRLYNSSQNEDGSPAGIVLKGLEPMPLDDWILTYATKQRAELLEIPKIYQKYI
jgi:hypothetical protein